MRPGEKYRERLTGSSVRVRQVEDTRVQVTSSETGDREWHDLRDFAAKFRPVAPNGRTS